MQLVEEYFFKRVYNVTTSYCSNLNYRNKNASIIYAVLRLKIQIV